MSCFVQSHAPNRQQLCLYFRFFSDKEEAALVKYIITMSKLFHGLTKIQTKQLAYKFAKNKNIKIPQNWIHDEAAGKDWLKGFRKRKADITLRPPEPTSLARAAAFNRKMWKTFFTIYEKFILEGTIFLLKI